MYYTHITKEDSLFTRRKKMEAIQKIYETNNKRTIIDEDRKEFLITSLDEEKAQVFFFVDGVILISMPEYKKVSFINLDEEQYSEDGFNGIYTSILFYDCVDATEEGSDHFNPVVYNYALNYSNENAEVVEIWKREHSEEEIFSFKDREEEVKKQGIFKIVGERTYTAFVNEGDTMNIIVFTESYNKDYVFTREINSIRVTIEQARIGLLSISE